MKEIDDFKEFCQTRQEKMRTDKLKDKVLFIWCVSKGISRQVTMEFWERGENKIAMALLAYKVCKHMNNKYEGSEAGEKMSKAMQYYGKLAIKLLGQCFCKDERLTFRLLIGRIPDLLDMTPFDIALDADFKAFIAEKPCRVLLDRFWTKPLSNLGNCYYIRFLVSIIFPLLSPFFMRFNNSWLNEHFEEADDFDEYDSEIEEYAKDDDDEEEDDNMILTIQSIYDEEDDDFNNCFRLLAVVYFYYKFVQFFIGTQTVRFIYNTMSHMSYLILFSYVMLTEFGKDTGLSTPEIILDVWTLVLWIEEIKQV